MLVYINDEYKTALLHNELLLNGLNENYTVMNFEGEKSSFLGLDVISRRNGWRALELSNYSIQELEQIEKMTTDNWAINIKVKNELNRLYELDRKHNVEELRSRYQKITTMIVV